MEQLTQVGTAIDINVLDECVANLLGSHNDLSNEEANGILMKFVEREDAYLCVPEVLASDVSSDTKFIALLALHKAVKYRWNCFVPEQRAQTQQMMIEFISHYIDNSGKPSHIVKANRIIVEIAKYDWPQRWPTFMTDLLESSHKSVEFGRNVFLILSMLADEVDESFENSLTSVRAQEMKAAFSEYIDQIIQLVEQALQSGEILLMKSALNALGRIVNYINPAVLLESQLLNEICTNFLSNPDLCVSVIGVIANAVSVPHIPAEEQDKIAELFDLIVGSLHPIIGEKNFSETEKMSGDEEFVEYFISAITSFLQQYSHLIETPDHASYLQQMLHWIYNITAESKNDVFEECLEYWVTVLRRIYLDVTGPSQETEPFPVYTEFFPQLVRTLIARLPAPVQCTSYLESDGTEHRKLINDAGFGTPYANGRESLVFLTFFNSEDVLAAFEERLGELTSGTLDYHQIKSLCYSIGAIPGAINQEVEDTFIPHVIDVLVQFIDASEGDVLAAASVGFMFISTQFSGVLKREQTLLLAVFEKIQAMMACEEIEVRENAVESLKKLASRCGHELIEASDSGVLTNILSNLEELIDPLFSDFVIIFFEVISKLIEATEEGVRADLTQQVFEYLSAQANELVSNTTGWDMQMLEDFFVILGCIKKIVIYLSHYIQGIIADYGSKLIEYYQYFSALVRELVAAPTETAQEVAAVQRIRALILTVFETFCSKHEDISFIKEFGIPNTLGAILDDFVESNPVYRIPQVFDLFSSFICRCPRDITPYLETILAKLYHPMVEMVGEDFDSFPEFRDNFYIFLRKLCQGAPIFITLIPEEDRNSFIECLKWGCMHPQQDINEIATKAMNELFISLSKYPKLFIPFCETYAFDILLFAYHILADVTFKSSFTHQVALIKTLMSNQIIRTHASELGARLCEMFPAQSPPDVTQMLTELFSEGADEKLYRNVLKNFLVSIRQISPTDPDLNKLEMEQMKISLNQQFGTCPGFIEERLPDQEHDIEERVSEFSERLSQLKI